MSPTRFTLVELDDQHPAEQAGRIVDTLALHRPAWQATPCPTPRKGCDRPDCVPGLTPSYEQWRHWHRHGYRYCTECTPDAGDIAPTPWPCRTTRTLTGRHDTEDHS